jgi:hypothetical protein
VGTWRNREFIYTQSQKARNALLVQYTNAVARRIGYNFPASITTPLVQALQITEFISIFLVEVIFSPKAFLE